MPRQQRGRGTGATLPRVDLSNSDPDFEEEEEEETQSQDQPEAPSASADLKLLLKEALSPLADRLEALEKKMARPAEEVDLASKQWTPLLKIGAKTSIGGIRPGQT